MNHRTPSVGTSTPRRGVDDLLTGRARYAADLDRPGQVHVRVVRSPLAHGRIAALDTAEALALPGVLAVYTADDLPDVRIPVRLPFAETAETPPLLQPPLARGTVRYVGEPVALVVAEDPYTAEDAAELVDVDIDDLDVAATMAAATAEGAPRLHESSPDNTVSTVSLRHGDVEAAFSRADVVVRERLTMHRHTAVPMETRGLLAEYEPATGLLTLWGGAKVKHFTRQALGAMLGLGPERVRVVEVHVGGGFGVRGEPYPEDFLVPFAAMRLGRPVKWTEDRAEHFVATNHAREQEHEWEIAATSDGRLLAFRDRAWCDQGAYVRSQGILPGLLPALHAAGPYRWEAFAVDSTGVLTNRTPTGTYRGPGMTEATFARERALDLLAAELGLDPAELRRRNLIPAAAMPFAFDAPEQPHVPPVRYESGDFPASFETLLDAAGYEALTRERQRLRRSGRLAGVGLAPYVEIGAVGPFEEAFVEAADDGTFTVRTGVSSLGQGVETVLAQIAADALSVPFEDVTVDFSDTTAVPMGFGAFASRSTLLAGNAIALAARDLLAKAAAEVGGDPGEVRFDRGTVRGPGGATAPAGRLPAGHGRFDKPHPGFSFGAALSLVTVDAATGAVRVLRHAVLHDVGRAVNPELVRGQLAGAASQGIGGALLEELVYDEQGQPLSTSFGDYLMPTAADLPEIDVFVVEYPTPTNPLGLKGAGESGMVGTPAAVANAVADALGAAARPVTRLPLTPGNVRELLRGTPSPQATTVHP
ncbi:xanthine dehydrogenase family protein molybdopterin-binding subunit [Streptomyces aculeolatus]|uniref:xanthine dehydrogenase family protein molybdopterin-binding subunit n=1 Tax=Streptomyces aculeolatus TaxID=270689 RepID=UPI001CED9669|nr:molybdopterin cofactor-binding domain-containing protein [Streptomyces aculeolatus]